MKRFALCGILFAVGLLPILLPLTALASVLIEGPTRVKRDTIATLTAKGVPDKAAVVWRFDRTKLHGIKQADGSLLLVGPPGVYAIEVQTIGLSKDGTTQVDEADATLEIYEDKAPTPGPTPTPAKPAAPVKAWVVVIEDTAQATTARGTFFADPTLAAFLAAKGWKSRVADVNAKDKDGNYPADLKPYRDRALAAGKALPWLIVVDEKGVPRAEGTLTQTPAELAVLLKEIAQ